MTSLSETWEFFVMLDMDIIHKSFFYFVASQKHLFQLQYSLIIALIISHEISYEIDVS